MKLDIFDINEFIKVNQIKQVTNRFYLGNGNNPSEDGLFSTVIFGKFSSEERKINFGYIDLRRKFFHPLAYIAVYQMFRALPQVISGDVYCRLDKNGNIETVKDPSLGQTGIDFFINNWSKIKWTKVGVENASRTKKENLLLSLKPTEIFIDKYLVIPCWYRDINFTKQSGSQKISIEGINALYSKLLNVAQSETITFTNSFLTQSSVQRTIVEIYTELTKKISGKRGIIRQAIMGKSIDNSTIGVLSCANLTSETVKEQQVPYNYFGVPLVQCLSLFHPFIIKWLADVFHDIEHSARIIVKGDKALNINEQVYDNLSTENLTKLVDSFIKDKTKLIRTQPFFLDGADSAKYISNISGVKNMPDRPYTIADLLYAAAKDVIHNKHVIATRYPITGSESVIVCRIKLLTTEKVVDVSMSREEGGIDNKFYTDYPFFPTDGNGFIVKEHIKWIDTYIPNVSYLKSIGGDFDGYVNTSSF